MPARSGLDAPSNYIQLAFMIDRHFPGYIDAYFGPAELKINATSGDTPSLSELEDQADLLGQSLAADSGLAPDRRAFLEEEWQAMRMTIQILEGHAPNIVDEVRFLYGVTPEWVDERAFERVHRALNEILPGPAPLSERVQAFRERSRVSVETALSIMRQLSEEFRGRTRRLFGLPAAENCEITTASNQPWIAYNWYLGGCKSRIEINTDNPMEMWDIPSMVAHEAYPGHHTEFSVKENKLYIGEGRLEHAIHLNNNPSSLISEGIAKNALMAVASESELTDIWIDCYDRAGLPRSDAVRAKDFSEANRQLESVTDNQVLLLYRDHSTEEEFIAYGMHYSLTTREDEERFLRFLRDPLSRSYTYNYTLGRELVAAFLDRETDRRDAFRRLLSKPVTPKQIAK